MRTGAETHPFLFPIRDDGRAVSVKGMRAVRPSEIAAWSARFAFESVSVHDAATH